MYPLAIVVNKTPASQEFRHEKTHGGKDTVYGNYAKLNQVPAPDQLGLVILSFQGQPPNILCVQPR